MNDLFEKYREERFAQKERVSFSPEQIQDMIKKGSEKKLGKIKSNIKIELLLTIVISVVVICIIGFGFHNYKEAIIASCIPVLPGVFYYFLYRRIKKISFTELDVKTSLKQAIDHLEDTLKLYYRIAVLGFPTLYFGIFVLIKLLGNEPFSIAMSKDGGTLTIGFLISIVLPPLTKWVLKHLYQKHIDELKTNLNILKM